MNKRNPQVDGYIRKNKRWQRELEAIREVILQCPLTEEVKWRSPCYTVDGGNVVMMGAFNDNCVLSFMKGALLKDPKGILVKPGENTRAARVVRFTSVDQIAAMKPVLKAYILEAIELEKAGLSVDLKNDAEPDAPEELQEKFEKTPALKRAFDALTPGRRRGYILYFASAKQPKTRAARIDKCAPQIMKGKGLHD